MSATNHTATIGLSQYISTDKPTYLTDYNGDMLAIDDAIAADRDSIATAQNKANTADGKADANKTSIDTLNAQINGDPSDPSDTGMAGKVNAIDGNVNTINSLIGNGSPTTSDQTIIGAVNGLEGSLAPREDGADLANSYAVGEQFARGGSVYTALTPLTAGTAFASLTLNTDYKNSDTLVEQIADVKSDVSDVASAVNSIANTIEHFDEYVEVLADGTKDIETLMNELLTSFINTISALTNRFVEVTRIIHWDLAGNPVGRYVIDTDAENPTWSNTIRISNISGAHDKLFFRDIEIVNNVVTESSQVGINIADSACTYTNQLTAVPTSGAVFRIYYRTYKKAVRIS